MAGSPLVALFFDEPRATAVVIVVAVNFLLEGLMVVPRSLMRRDLEFRRLAIIDGLAGVVMATVGDTVSTVKALGVALIGPPLAASEARMV